jgi:hypothetical protein
MRRFAIYLFAFGLLYVAPSAAVPGPLDPLKFLIGDWKADPDQSGATGGFTFEMRAQDHAMIRTNFSNTPASAGKPASRHDDVMMIYADGDKLKADYADSEGHVIRYDVKTGEDKVMFESGAKANEPRYRLRYAKNSDGSLAGAFDIAAPGAPDFFKPYLSWKARKTK